MIDCVVRLLARVGFDNSLLVSVGETETEGDESGSDWAAEDASSSEDEPATVAGAARPGGERRGYGGRVPFAQAAKEARSRAVSMNCTAFTWCK